MITTVPCPLCRSDSRELFVRETIGIRGCERCGHQFADVEVDSRFVETVYGDDYFLAGKAGYPDYLREQSILRRHGQRYGRLVNRHTSPGRVLDLGAAAGFLLQGFLDTGWSGVGVEPNSRMADYGKTVLGLPMVAGRFEEVEFDDEFDLVSCIQVLAHLADPVLAVGKIEQLLRPGGYLLIETWDRDSWVARAFGTHWHEYSPPSVLHYFGRRQIDQLLTRNGFQRIASGRPAKWISGAHAKSLVDYKLSTMPIARHARGLLRAVPDRVPFPYPAFDLAWFLYRKI